jgi:hypothetical protein
MSTRQLRLNGPDQIRQNIKRLLGKKINVVLTDDTVVFGKLKEANALEIQLLNMRLKKVSYPFTKITEIYLDTNA